MESAECRKNTCVITKPPDFVPNKQNKNFKPIYEEIVELIYVKGQKTKIRENDILELKNVVISLNNTSDEIYTMLLKKDNERAATSAARHIYKFSKKELDEYIESFYNKQCPDHIAYTYRSRINYEKLKPLIKYGSKQAYFPIFVETDYEKKRKTVLCRNTIYCP